MSTGPIPPNPRSEALAWWVRLGDRGVGDETLQRFEVWRQRPENAAAYCEIVSQAADRAARQRK